MLRVNRRTAIGGLLGAAPAAFAPAWAQPPAGPERIGVAPNDDSGISIVLDSWTDVYGRPTASVMLNGKGPFSFLVDTGSAATVMADRVALALGGVTNGTLTIVGATGSATRPYTLVDKLQTGAVTQTNLRVAILPDATLARADGILGGDVFAGKRLVFSIRDKIVRIETSRRVARAPVVGNMNVRQGLLAEVEGSVAKIPAKLILDTGADYSIANAALGQALRIHPRLARVPHVRVMGVTGHPIEGEYIALPSVDVRAFTVQDCAAVIANASIFKLWRLESEPAMIVGVDLLSRLATFSIDYGTQEFDATLFSELMARNQAAFG